MAVRNWHWGKIFICWVIAAFPTWLGYIFVQSVREMRSPAAEVVLSLMLFLGPPILTLALTWRWLGGKEKPSNR